MSGDRELTVSGHRGSWAAITQADTPKRLPVRDAGGQPRRKILKNEQENLTEAQQISNQVLELLREVNQRTTRTESRMVELGDHVGANIRMPTQIHLGKAAPVCCILGDVSIERCESRRNVNPPISSGSHKSSRICSNWPLD
ncbi:UNVERIFIED_ORG: hypothetical protein BDU10_5437 [Burkholderia sp. CF145]|jgi:hypothetical protein